MDVVGGGRGIGVDEYEHVYEYSGSTCDPGYLGDTEIGGVGYDGGVYCMVYSYVGIARGG